MPLCNLRKTTETTSLEQQEINFQSNILYIASEYHFAKKKITKLILDAPYQKRLNDGEYINSLLCGIGHFTSFMLTGGYINLQYGVFKKYIIIPDQYYPQVLIRKELF